MRWSLLLLSVGTLAAVAVVLLSSTWNERAEDICRDETPRAGSSYSVTWEWDEFAYVCDYRAPDEKRRRVGIVDAFHSGGSQRHRPDR